ncbi:ABC transporter ATP-binding protein [Saccharomonospora iraqiensis]|uniref:ABC transporter ATP-binding protein n=1 Tax=Saccharomonospora iraqiensis TaxID=52698 RepID=UPI0003F7B6E4|nr:ABC transporter ATP-binding protein [Saccharomonospora iraqiensis]
MAPAIRLHQVSKSFGRARALAGLDLTVHRGEVHGLLGPNGAGKSTAIRVLLGMLRPGAGGATVLGRDPWSAAPELHRRLAYVPGDVSLWPNLTGGEVIDLLTRMHGTGSRARRDELIERFELDPAKRSRTYSKGNRQKVGLVTAFSLDADLLVLDEPTSGLDPLMNEVFKECVREANRAGRTVLLSSHILSEVEQLCGRVSIVRSGRTVDAGSLAELRAHAATMVTATLATAPDDLSGIEGVRDVVADGTRITVTTTRYDALMTCLARAGIESLTVTPPTLEDLFLHYYPTTTTTEPVR